MDIGQSHVTYSIYFESRLFIYRDLITLKQTVEDPGKIEQYFRQLAHASENTIALDDIYQEKKDS